jgi:acyl-CoA thioester hydrolase
VSVFVWPARVYWEDTDGGGIVYYANYLRFLERARTEWLRSLGLSQQLLATDPGILFAVVSLAVEYRRPARLDDELAITCEARVEGAATLRFAQRIFRGTSKGVEDEQRAGSAAAEWTLDDRPLVEASVRVACLDAQALRPRRLPDCLLNHVAGPRPAASNLKEPS